MRAKRGFSLIELLIVVAIILIIAAIAIPNFFRSRIAANEASAVSSIHVINTAEITYISTYPSVGYSLDLGALAGTGCPASTSSSGACLIDSTLASATTAGTSKTGYWFTYSPADSSSTVGYTIYGAPAQPQWSGVRFFYSDATNVVHYKVGSQAETTDPTIQ